MSVLATRTSARPEPGWYGCPGEAASVSASRPLGLGFRTLLGLLVLACLLPSVGCRTVSVHAPTTVAKVPPVAPLPRELEKTTLPPYVLEPPDILLIDAVKVVPKPPYAIEPLDVLQISATGTLLEFPVDGPYAVGTDGTVNLGPAYGRARVVGLTIEEATDEVRTLLERTLTQPEVAVSLLQTAGEQQIVGEHLLGPDGTVNLGTYGTVFVAGLTIPQAKQRIEGHLSQFLDDPRVSVDVFAFNSKVYYVVTEGGGNGDGIARFPITGNETVLDALSLVGGTSSLSSNRIWVARPAPDGLGYEQVLPVDWNEIIRGGSTATNYQIFPGDRILIESDRMVAFDTMVGKITAPFERIFGFMLLGGQSIQTINRFPRGGGQGNFF